VDNLESIRQKLAQCRRLAEVVTDPAFHNSLLKLAQEYEQQAGPGSSRPETQEQPGA